jgi:hypothetical protein
MIYYTGRSYCQHYKICKHGETCDRALTDKVKEGAKKVNLPFSIIVNPECFEVKE